MLKKVAIVMGGTGGIGSAVTRKFIDSGMRVYALYHSNSKKARLLQNETQDCFVIKCDIRREEEAREVINKILQKEKQVDILVDAVTSSLKIKVFEDITVEEFKEDFDTIVFGAVNVFKQIVGIMKKSRNGVILSLGTTAILDFPSRMSSYVAAKSALAGLMHCLAKECSLWNVRLISIAPSFVETSLLSAFPEKLLEIERNKQPQKHFFKPEAIADIVLSAVEDSSRYPNGTEIILRGEDDLKKI